VKKLKYRSVPTLSARRVTAVPHARSTQVERALRARFWSLDIFKALSGPLWSTPAEQSGDGALTPLHPRPSG
jgi:hypothetical protein